MNQNSLRKDYSVYHIFETEAYMKHILKLLYGIIALLSVMILVTVFSFIRRNQSSGQEGSVSVAGQTVSQGGPASGAVISEFGSFSSADSAVPARTSASGNTASAEISSDNTAVSANTADSSADSAAASSPSDSEDGTLADQESRAAEETPENTQNIIDTDQTVILDTVMGKMQYFNQQDSHWGSYLISGKDPMSTNGCGPTCVAMLIHAFGRNGGQVTPVTMADWAVANHQYVVGAGSQHSIIEAALPAYGFTVTSLQNSVSKETLLRELKQKHLLIGLMGPGYFTEEGHYLLMTGIDGNGNICIADPHSSENTSKSFSADFLISQLRTNAKDGGAPLWSISVAS